MKTICWFEDVWGGPDRVPNVGAGAGAALRRAECRHALLQQPQLPQLAAGHGGGLRALVRNRRHHVGIRTAGRVCQCAQRGAWRHSAEPHRRDLLLRVLRAQSARPRHQRGTRPRRLYRACRFHRCGHSRQTARGWLLCRGVAPDAALSGTAGLGDALDRQPARNLRRHAPEGESGQTLHRHRLAHLAQQFLQSHLSRRAGPSANSANIPIF